MYISIITDEQSPTAGAAPQAEAGANVDAEHEALKDQVDGAVPTTEKIADQSSGGRVFVAETGDLSWNPHFQ